MTLMQRLNDWSSMSPPSSPLPPSINIDPPLLASLLSMTSLVEARDPYTGGHLWRVSNIAHCWHQRRGLPMRKSN